MVLLTGAATGPWVPSWRAGGGGGVGDAAGRVSACGGSTPLEPGWGAGPAALAQGRWASFRRPGRWQRLREDHCGQDDHRGPRRALGGLAVHGLLLQGEERACECRPHPRRAWRPRPGLRSPGRVWRGPRSPRSLLPQVLTTQQQEQAAHNNFNFDHPDAFDFDLIVSTLKKLKQGKSVKVPVYDFTTHSRKKDWVGLMGWGCARPPGSTAGAAGDRLHHPFAENTVRGKRDHLRGHHGLC